MIHLDPQKRHDVLIVLGVHHSNLNGDPDNGGVPRTDPMTGLGYATAESLKRKLRDYVTAVSETLSAEAQARSDIQIGHGAVLALVNAAAYSDLGIAFSHATPFSDEDIVALLDLELPAAFTVEEGTVRYDGSLKKAEITRTFKELRGAGLEADLVSRLEKLTQAKEVTASERVANEKRVIPHLQAKYWDARMFGFVSPGQQISAGKTRGAWQLTNLQSLAPVQLLESAITRVARAKSDDKEGGNFGRRTVVPHATYAGQAYYNPLLGLRAGVTEGDMRLFYDGLKMGYELSRSSSRPDVRVEKIVVFTHDSKYGLAPSHTLFERLNLRPDGDGYTLEETLEDLPEGVTLSVL